MSGTVPTAPPGDAPSADAAMPPSDVWIRRSRWLGRVIVVCAVVATVVMLVLVQRIGRTYEDGLEVTAQSAHLVSDSVEPARVIAEDLAELTDAVAAGIDGTREVVATASDTLGAIGDASATNIAESADAAAAVADELAGFLETVERFIPGDRQSVAEELRSFSDGLEPVADQLRSLGDQLTTGAEQLVRADATLGELAISVQEVATGIEQLGPTLDELELTADDLAIRAEEASDRVDTDLWLLRLLVVVLGVALACTGFAIELFARHLGAHTESVRTRSSARPLS
jgi:methyl-accepting chemotaxis protein